MQIDRYQVRTEIARGGFGAVYRAWDPVLERDVAIKVLLDHRDEDEVERFLREGQAATRISHPNVLTVLGGGSAQGRPYLVLEFVEGPTLANRIQRERQLLVVEAVELVIALCAGVQAAHQAGVLHRDLKPQNVLFLNGRPLLTDFGIARVANARSLTQTGELLGTPGYMAPEQIQGDRARLGPATDVYGLGAILYASLTGLPPFQEPTILATLDRVLNSSPPPPSAHRPELDRGLDAICAKALSRDPSERYPSAAEFGAALEAWATPEPAAAGGRGALVPLLVACAILVGLLGVALAFALAARPPGPSLSPSPTHAATPSATPSGTPGLAGSPAPSLAVSPAPPSPSPSRSHPLDQVPAARLLLSAQKAVDHDPKEALRFLEGATGLDPQVRNQVLVERAFAHVKLRQLGEAAACLNATKGRAGSRAAVARADYVAGRRFYELGEIQSARARFRSAHEAEERSAPYLAWYGISSPAKERAEIWARAKRLAPEDPAVLYLEFLLTTYRKSPTNAQNLALRFEAALLRAPASPYLVVHLPRLHWYSRQATQALKSARDAVRAWPAYRQGYREAGWIAVQLAQQLPDKERWINQAKVSFDAGLELFPDDVGLLRERAWLYLMEGKFKDSALAHEDLLRREKPPSAWTLHNTYLSARRYLTNIVKTRDLEGLKNPARVADLAHGALDYMAGMEGNYLSTRPYGRTPEVVARTRAELQVLLGRALGISRRWEQASNVLDLEVKGPLEALARYFRLLNREERARYTLNRLAEGLEEDWNVVFRSGHAAGVADCLEGRALRKLPLPSQAYLDKVAPQNEGIRLRLQLCRALAAKPFEAAAVAKLRERVVQLRPHDLLAWYGLLRHQVRSNKPIEGLKAYKQAPPPIRQEPLIVALAGELLSLSAHNAQTEVAGRYAKAEEAFARAAAQVPEFEALQGALFAHWLRRHDAAKARQVLSVLEPRLSAKNYQRFLRHIEALEAEGK